MIKVTPEQFEQIVWDAVDALPAFVQERMSNLEFEVRYQPTRDELGKHARHEGGDLFGLYHGVPLTERTTRYEMVVPDLITIYQRAHERHCSTLEQLRAQVAHTVRHEVAHHFGISDDRLEELGAY
jgi:predicted Zn-dependent protease with MMP-like domain